MLTDTANLPAKLIKEFRGDGKKPALKAAYIDSDVFFGEESLETLATLKSKEELVGDIIFLLQSPAKNVISALMSGGNTIAGLVKTLEERNA
jgi:large subunit ribosomal protein L10